VETAIKNFEVSHFQPHIGSTFQLEAFDNGASQSVSLELHSVEPQQLHAKDGRITHPDPAIRSVPFSALLLGSKEQRLQQGVYNVIESPLGSGWEMFVCCRGLNSDKTHMVYEVIYG
jgi:hypothetical protein